MDTTGYIADYIALEKKTLDALNVDDIRNVLDLFMEAYKSEGTIYVFGNGGSASTASHMANDFNKGISEYVEKKFRLICLNDNIATLMAIANDIGYDEVFRFQLKNKLKPNDLVVGISGSGNSKNVLYAIEYAKERHVKTLGICGYDGGKLKQTADAIFHVAVPNMQIVEDVHMILNHLLMNVINRVLGITDKC